jgi:hypothetical protein
MLTRKGQDLLAVAALIAMLAVASTLAIIRIGVSQRPVDPALDPSPLGYTLSLALFIVPCMVFGVWLWRSPRTAEQRHACVITLLLLTPWGSSSTSSSDARFCDFPTLTPSWAFSSRATICIPAGADCWAPAGIVNLWPLDLGCWKARARRPQSGLLKRPGVGWCVPALERSGVAVLVGEPRQTPAASAGGGGGGAVSAPWCRARGGRGATPGRPRALRQTRSYRHTPWLRLSAGTRWCWARSGGRGVCIRQGSHPVCLLNKLTKPAGIIHHTLTSRASTFDLGCVNHFGRKVIRL